MSCAELGTCAPLSQPDAASPGRLALLCKAPSRKQPILTAMLSQEGPTPTSFPGLCTWSRMALGSPGKGLEACLRQI